MRFRFQYAFFVMAGFALFCTSVQARSSFALGIEPVVGYDVAYWTDPTPHTHPEFVYGARATLGWSLFSIEGEYLHGSDSASYSSSTLTTSDTTDEAKLGIRFGFHIARAITFFLRGGVDALQDWHQDNAGGAITSSNSLYLNPYAGAGLAFQAGSRFFLTLETVAVFNSWPNMNANSYEPTIGLMIRLP